MTFNELQSAVEKAPIGIARITDVTNGDYKLAIEEGDSADKAKLFLVSEKTGKKHSITVNGLAAMRVVASASDAAKATTTADARVSPDYANLQARVAEENGVKITDKTKFTAVHSLRILDAETELPVFKNSCYIGYPAYIKAARSARTIVDATERNNKYNELNDSLRSSGVKKNTKETAENLILMPVFMVS